jgi:hypothetical protein
MHCIDVDLVVIYVDMWMLYGSKYLCINLIIYANSYMYIKEYINFYVYIPLCMCVWKLECRHVYTEFMCYNSMHTLKISHTLRYIH